MSRRPPSSSARWTPGTCAPASAPTSPATAGSGPSRRRSGRPPRTAGTSSSAPPGRPRPPTWAPHADVKALVQASFHGATADEAEGLADACVPILLDRTKYTIAGRYVDQPELRTYRGATKDPDTSIDRYSAHLIVAIPTTPA
jgi:hypothetical protein